MAIDDKVNEVHGGSGKKQQLVQLARERQGFYKGKQGYYVGTSDRGDDIILLSQRPRIGREELLEYAHFGIYELGMQGMELLDLAVVQMHDIIAGPFESWEEARIVLPYVIKERYKVDKV
ncbi:hypothetical protein HYS47_02735 [Candidatus Woesearchaeota archaeon]|nr:hypothetical protein [Candidatus Woesearchaeota archaeon]